MYDVVSLYLTDDAVRHVAIWTLSVSALIIFLLAFAVTEGAGFHGPLALLKGAQRFILCALSIACAYAAACIVYFGWTPPGPILILFVAFSISTSISAVRHLLGPALAANNTWDSARNALRAKIHQAWTPHFGLAVDEAYPTRRRYPPL
jgi:hypothetical protein